MEILRKPQKKDSHKNKTRDWSRFIKKNFYLMLPPAFSIFALAVAEYCSIPSKDKAFSKSQFQRTFTAT